MSCANASTTVPRDSPRSPASARVDGSRVPAASRPLADGCRAAHPRAQRDAHPARPARGAGRDPKWSSHESYQMALTLGSLRVYGTCMTTITRISFARRRRHLRAIAALDASAELEPRLRELVRIRASRSTAAPSASTCIPSTRRRRARTIAASSRSPPGTRARSSTSASAQRWRSPSAHPPAGGRRPTGLRRRGRAFGEDELAHLIGVIIAINAWNRVAIGTALQPEAWHEQRRSQLAHSGHPELRDGPPWVMQEMIEAQPGLAARSPGAGRRDDGDAISRPPRPATARRRRLRDVRARRAGHRGAARRGAARAGFKARVECRSRSTPRSTARGGFCLGISHDGTTRATILALEAARGTGAVTATIGARADSPTALARRPRRS